MVSFESQWTLPAMVKRPWSVPRECDTCAGCDAATETRSVCGLNRDLSLAWPVPWRSTEVLAANEEASYIGDKLPSRATEGVAWRFGMCCVAFGGDQQVRVTSTLFRTTTMHRPMVWTVGEALNPILSQGPRGRPKESTDVVGGGLSTRRFPS